MNSLLNKTLACLLAAGLAPSVPAATIQPVDQITAIVNDEVITRTELEQRLGDRFLRVHRNAIVARSAVQALERRASVEEGAEGWAVCIRPTGEWLEVSRRQAGAVRDALAAGGL